MMSWGNKKTFLNHPQACERDKWSDDKICRLVCLYKKFPCLWKNSNPSYMDNSARHAAYSSIHQGMEIFQMTFTEVMIKIREVRRIYVNELKKIFKAYSSGRTYEPPQKWFVTLHNFLYEYLDFDETAELRGLENSASSCYQEYDNVDFEDECDSESVDSEVPSSSCESPRIPQCRKIPQRISCNSSKVSSSTADYLPQKNNSKRSPSLRTDALASRFKHRPIKIVRCPQHGSPPISQVCYDSPRAKKSTSVTVICEKKTGCRSRRIEMDRNSQCKAPSTPSCPKSSSIEKFDSNESLNTALGKTHDEFDVFAKSVACQLRKMDIESAIVAQNQIQKVLTDQRLRRTSIRPEASETKNLLVVQESPSSQQSITLERSGVLKPARSTSKRLFLTKPNFHKNETRSGERSSRNILAKLLPVPDQPSQRELRSLSS